MMSQRQMPIKKSHIRPKSSGFTIGKPDPNIEMSSISILENCWTKSFAGAITDFATYVLWDESLVINVLDVDDCDVFNSDYQKDRATDLSSKLNHIGVSVKLYRYDNTSANLIYVVQYGSSDRVAHIVVHELNKFSLIASMHGLTEQMCHKSLKKLCVRQYIDPISIYATPIKENVHVAPYAPIKQSRHSEYVTPIKEKVHVAPHAPIKQSRHRELETPQIETLFRQSFEHSEPYSAFKKSAQLVDRICPPAKKSKKGQFMTMYKCVCNKLVEQQLHMEQCIDVIAQLADALSESTQKATRKSEEQTYHDRCVQIELSNGLIEQLVAKRNQQKSTQCTIDTLLARKKDLELFINVLAENV